MILTDTMQTERFSGCAFGNARFQLRKSILHVDAMNDGQVVSTRRFDLHDIYPFVFEVKRRYAVNNLVFGTAGALMILLALASLISGICFIWFGRDFNVIVMAVWLIALLFAVLAVVSFKFCHCGTVRWEMRDFRGGRAGGEPGLVISMRGTPSAEQLEFIGELKNALDKYSSYYAYFDSISDASSPKSFIILDILQMDHIITDEECRELKANRIFAKKNGSPADVPAK